jgi:hypothetical protein
VLDQPPEGSPEDAGLMLGAFEDFAQELCGVLHHILDLDSRALRQLKPDPVPEGVLTKILDAAIRAPPREANSAR